MHELGVAQSVLETVRAEVEKHEGARAHRVGLRIGELAAVDPEALRFAFEVLTRGTDFEQLELAIEVCPRRQQCPECAEVFAVKDFEFTCPRCGAKRTECVGGAELEFDYLEVEDGPSIARKQSA